MELAKTIDCPNCGKDIPLQSSGITITFRGHNYDIDHWYYHCKGCREDYTTEESDTKTLSQIPNYPNPERVGPNYDQNGR